MVYEMSCNRVFYHLLPNILVQPICNAVKSETFNLGISFLSYLSPWMNKLFLPTSLKNDYRLLNQHKYFCILYIIHCIMAPCNKCANKSNIDLMHAYVNTFFCKSVQSVSPGQAISQIPTFFPPSKQKIDNLSSVGFSKADKSTKAVAFCQFSPL